MVARSHLGKPQASADPICGGFFCASSNRRGQPQSLEGGPAAFSALLSVAQIAYTPRIVSMEGTMRFTFGSLMGLLAFGGLCYLTLTRPDPLWRGLLDNTYWALLLLMLVAAIAGAGQPRRFAIGFISASLAYFAICFGPGVEFRPRLFTDHALRMVYEQQPFAEQPSIAFASPASGRVEAPTLRAVETSLETPRIVDGALSDDSKADSLAGPVLGTRKQYFDVGHMLWTLACGFLGGLVGSALADSKRERSTTTPPV